jgi:DNA-binding PadR family transcriptional regulator
MAQARRRKVYALTPFGQRVLSQELERLQALLEAAHQAELTIAQPELGSKGV